MRMHTPTRREAAHPIRSVTPWYTHLLTCPCSHRLDTVVPRLAWHAPPTQVAYSPLRRGRPGFARVCARSLSCEGGHRHGLGASAVGLQCWGEEGRSYPRISAIHAGARGWQGKRGLAHRLPSPSLDFMRSPFDFMRMLHRNMDPAGSSSNPTWMLDSVEFSVTCDG